MSLLNIHKEIGTARDNRSEPIHDWYRFTAGFSYKLVDKIIELENLGSDDVIYESFAGCGTTLVAAQNNGIRAVGNEAQKLLYDVIQAKLNWNINSYSIKTHLNSIATNLDNGETVSYHELLTTLYSDSDLAILYFIRNYIDSIENEEEKLFLKLALTQVLHKTCIHPIAVPYISRSKTLKHELSALESFEQTVLKMLHDISSIENFNPSSTIFYHDSRKKNELIEDNSCTICITSPPYLNNLDYGEVSKVCSHFFGITDNWNDITTNVRKNLVTGATTHYKESEFVLKEWLKNDFYLSNQEVVDLLLPKVKAISEISKTRKGKKSFDILTLLYFEDMYHVLVEMRRVLKANSKAYLILGDSAPYGVFIDTTKILGEIAKNVGFTNYEIVKIRDRGTKWKLKHRHQLKLSENILILE